MISKTAEPKKNSSSVQRKTNQSFFNRSAENSFFSTGKTEPGFFGRSNVQPKLAVGKPGDKYEREADAVADKVVQRQAFFAPPAATLGKTIQRCSCGDDKKAVQRKEMSGNTSGHATTLSSTLTASKGRGSALPQPTRVSMEQAFGTDFGGVRVHTGSEAVQMSQDLQAHAFTYGNDIYFNSGKYSPDTSSGKHLLAHELTHTIQQGASNAPAVQADFWDDASDLAGAAVDTVSSAGSAAYEAGQGAVETATSAVGEAYDSASSAAGEAYDTAASAAGGAYDAAASAAGGAYDAAASAAGGAYDAVADAAGGAYDAVADAAGGAYDAAAEAAGGAIDAVSSAASGAYEATKDAVEAVSQAGSDAVDWIVSEAGQLALAAANSLVARFGGKITVSGTTITITIPNVTLFNSFQQQIGESIPPRTLFKMPFFAAPIGSILFTASLEVHATPSLQAAVGPGELRNISVSVDPFSTSFAGHAELYVAGAIGPRIALFGGIVGEGKGVIPMDPPIPILASLEGGVKGTGTGWGVGAINSRVDVGYSGGAWSLNADNDLKLGALIQGDLDLSAAARMYEVLLCEYSYPLGHWETGEAWNINLPLGIGGGGPPTVGPVTVSEIPISSIETAIKPLEHGLKCKGTREIMELFCKEKKLPEEICKALLNPGQPDPLAPLPIVPPGPPGGGGPGTPGVTATKSAPTGKDSSDPIEMIWFKPQSGYPASIDLTFDPDNDPKPWDVYKMGTRKRLPAKGLKGRESIGGVKVPPKEPMKKDPTKDGGEKGSFRADLEEYGFEWDGDFTMEADHVRDLEFGGQDSDKNLWPLEKSINGGAGTCHAFQQPEHSNVGDPPGTVRTDQPIHQLKGRWFIIKDYKFPTRNCK